MSMLFIKGQYESKYWNKWGKENAFKQGMLLKHNHEYFKPMNNIALSSVLLLLSHMDLKELHSSLQQ